MHINSEKSRGFTLVELSIVLVIVGLLIGGILVAQSMINTAKVQATIRQIQQFDVGVANFQTKYGQLPGDSTAFGCVTVNTNVCNNNVIDDVYTVSSPQDLGDPQSFSAEVANFWPHMQQSGFTNPGGGTLTATVTGNFTTKGTSPNSPSISIGTNTGVVAIGIANISGIGFAKSGSNYYMLGDFSAIVNSTTFLYPDAAHFTVSAVDALAIDTKIDNGTPDADLTTDSVVKDFAGAYSIGTCSSGGKYNVASSAAKCELLIKMMASTGTNR